MRTPLTDELRQREVQELVTIVRELAQLLNRSGQGESPEMRQACEMLGGASRSSPEDAAEQATRTDRG